MEHRAERLRQARIRAGYTSAAKAADALGIRASTYRAHENGQNNFDTEEAGRYARFFKCDVGWLLIGEGTPRADKSLTIPTDGSGKVASIPVLGFVKAGVWQDIEGWGVGTMDEFVPSASEYPTEWQYAYTVDGDSLNKIAQSGDRLICLDLGKSGAWFEDGDLVIAQRTRFGGQMIERSAKRVRQTTKGFELWPESTHPDHQKPISLELHGETDELRVVAKVLWILKRP